MIGHDAGDLGQAQPGKELVQDQQVGLQGDGLGQFQAFEVSLGQGAGRLVGHVGVAFEADLFQQIQGHRVAVAVSAPRQRLYPGGVEGDDHVLVGRQVVKGFDHLKRSGNAEAHDFVGGQMVIFFPR